MEHVPLPQPLVLLAASVHKVRCDMRHWPGLPATVLLQLEDHRVVVHFCGT